MPEVEVFFLQESVRDINTREREGGGLPHVDWPSA